MIFRLVGASASLVACFAAIRWRRRAWPKSRLCTKAFVLFATGSLPREVHGNGSTPIQWEGWRWGIAAVALALTAPATASADDARQVAATLCAACHAEDGNSVIPNFPKLAGQPAPYLAKQLDDFRSGKRRSDSMAPVLAGVKAGDVAALAAHFSAQKPAPGRVQDAALAAAGEQLYRKGNEATGVPACAACHLADGSGDEKNPRVAGQHQTYVIAEMMKFKTGARANDRRRAMRVLAELMTEAEIRAVAEYMAGL